MVAPTATVDGEGLAADFDFAAHAAVLVEMAARKIAPVHGLHGIVDRLAAVHWAFALVHPVDVAGHFGAIGEQRLRIAQRVGIVDDQQLAVECHRHFFQRLDHGVGEAAGIEAIVAADAGPLKLAGDPPVGQISKSTARHSLR